MKTENSIKEQKTKCKKLKKEKDSLSASIVELQTQIDKIPEEVTSVENLMTLIERKTKSIEDIRKQNSSQHEEIKNKRENLNSIIDFSASFSIAEKKDQQNKYIYDCFEKLGAYFEEKPTT